MEAASELAAYVPRSTHHGQLFVLFAVAYAFVLCSARAASRLHEKTSTQLHKTSISGSIASGVPSLSSTSDTSSIEGSIDRKGPLSQLQEARNVSDTSETHDKLVEVSSTAAWKLRRTDRVFFFVVFNVAFAYLYFLSSYVTLGGKWKVFLNASFSLVVKIALQEATKHFVLNNTANGHRQILPPLLIHAAMTIPTVVVGLSKILRLRRMISSRLTQNSGIRRGMKRVNSKIAAHDAARMRAEYSQFLVWKLHVLRLHAAEVYADMHGEYTSMGCAMAITVFLGGGRLALFDLTPGAHCGDTSTMCSRRHAKMGREQLSAVLTQVAPGILVDYAASVVEIIHEVPLLETINGEGDQLRSFVRILLAALAAVNVSAVTLFYLKPT